MRKKADPGYEYQEHTGDIRVKARGRTREELFLNSCRAVCGLISASPSGDGLCEELLELEDDSTETLLKTFLGEIIYFIFGKQLLPVDIKNLKIKGTRLQSSVVLSGMDTEAGCREIKAVTYHDLYYKEEKEQHEAGFVLDV
jgi:SHS2 domain-containing protein